MQLTPFGIFISDTVEKLKRKQIKRSLISTYCFLADAKSYEDKTCVCVCVCIWSFFYFFKRLRLTDLHHYLYMDKITDKNIADIFKDNFGYFAFIL